MPNEEPNDTWHGATPGAAARPRPAAEALEGRALLSAVAFQAAQSYPTGTSPSSVAAGDFRLSGRLDLVVTNSSPGAGTSFLSNQGGGAFAPAVPLSSQSISQSAATADMNRDGKPDLVLAGTNFGLDNGFASSNQLIVLPGNGDGTFGSPIATAVSGSSSLDPGSLSVSVGDLNGDGNPDAVIGNYSDGQFAVLLGNGDGTFQPQRNFSLGGNSADLVLADFNRDGHLDVAAVVVNQVSVSLGNGDGTFQAARLTSLLTGGLGGLPTAGQPLAAGDVNGDGIPDLVVPGAYPPGVVNPTQGVGVLLGRGDGNFAPVQSYGHFIAIPSAAVIADFNGDGRPDVAVADSNGKVFIVPGNGDGTFQDATAFAVDSGAASIIAADLNNDGKPDLATANFNAGTVSVLLNSSSGSPAPAPTPTPLPTPTPAPTPTPVGSTPVEIDTAKVQADQAALASDQQALVEAQAFDKSSAASTVAADKAKIAADQAQARADRGNPAALASDRAAFAADRLTLRRDTAAANAKQRADRAAGAAKVRADKALLKADLRQLRKDQKAGR